MQIGELSRRTSCNIETIRYYERSGLLPQPARRGKYRQYGDGDAQRLSFIRRSRELGFALDEVRVLLDLAAGCADSCTKARHVASHHLAAVRRRISDLKRMERVLAEVVRDCDSGEHAGCPLIEALAADVRPSGTP